MPTYKSETAGYIFALLFGGIGVHHFYYRNYIRGIVYLLFCWTLIPVILGWVDMLFIKKWNSKINAQLEASVSNTSGRKVVHDYANLSESIKQNSEETEKEVITSKKPVKELLNEYSLYLEKDIILPKYEHLQTLRSIEANVHAIVYPTKGEKQSIVSITYSSSQINFARDSYKYRNKRQSKCQEIPLKEYWTTFSKLNDRQLKWYFYWREQVLKGTYMEVDLSYLILFTYELINYTFHPKASYNVSMLVRLHDNYIGRIPKLENYLPSWIADMLLELGEGKLANEWRPDLETKPALYTQLIEKRDALERISITSWKPYIHNYRETVFFLNNKSKVYKTFKESIPLLKEYHEDQGSKLENVWFERVEHRNVRPLFISAVLARDIDDVHVYTANYVPTERFQKEITALFKIAENVTRSLNGENREIKVEGGILPDDFKQRIIERLEQVNSANKRFKVVQEKSKPSIGSVIPRPANEQDSTWEQKSLNRVTSIQFNDEIIEAKAKENIALQNEISMFMERNSSINNETRFELKYFDQTHSVNKEKSSYIKKDRASGVFNELINSSPEESIFNKQDLIPGSVEAAGLVINEFVESMTDIEVEFLSKFDSDHINSEEAKLFLKQRGQMTGMFLSTLNEKSNEFLGDNLLEEQGENIAIYEEFGQVIELVKER